MNLPRLGDITLMRLKMFRTGIMDEFLDIAEKIILIKTSQTTNQSWNLATQQTILRSL